MLVCRKDLFVYIFLNYRRFSPINVNVLNMNMYSQRRKDVLKLVPEGV
ncbi:hypothetical protein SPPR111872_12335 [Sphingobacterium prati]